METVLRVFQVFLAVGLIGVVLLQRSEGGGLGIGSSGGMGSFMSVRGTANLLTRVTAVLAGLFMITCLALVLIAQPRQQARSIFDTQNPSAPIQIPAGQIPVGQVPASPAPTNPAPASQIPAGQAPAPQPAVPANQNGAPAPRGQ